jgi:hypothetical protein
MSSLQEERVLQERLSRFLENDHGKERDSVRRGLHKKAKDTLKSQMVSKQMSKLLAMFL